jgi:hypothetical protein
MHRSGTSAVTRVLNLLGAELPENLMPSAEDNPRGFWESRDLMMLHDEMLQAGGSSWDDWTRLSPDWLEPAIASGFRARLLALLEANFGRSRVFVVKDPRICRMMPLWRSVLREFGATVRVVIPVRNPVEVAASLGSRNGLSTAWCMLVWLRHVIDAERETRDLPRSVIRFRDLLHDRHQVLAVVRRRLGIRWPRPIAAVQREIDEFLSVAERHHSVDDLSIDQRQDVPAWVRRAYEAVGSIARDGESAQAHTELDEIGSDLDGAAVTFGPIVAEQIMANRARSAEIDALRSSSEQHEALQRELATVRSQLLERGAEAERVSGELSNARGELSNARGELSNARGDLAQHLAEVQKLTGELSALRGVLEDRSSEVAQLRDTLTAHEVAARESSLEIEALRADLADREADVDRLRQQVSEAHSQLDYMLHSVSWRLTAPLRAVRGRL